MTDCWPDNQTYTQWPQAPQNYWQGQAPQSMQQPGYGQQTPQSYQAQNPWSIQQPSYGQQTPQSYQTQSYWDTRQPSYDWQAPQSYHREQNRQPQNYWKQELLPQELGDWTKAQQAPQTNWQQGYNGYPHAGAVEGLPEMAPMPPLKITDVTLPAEVPPKGKKSALSLLFNSLFYILIAVIIGGGAMFALSKNPQKSYFGYRLYTVKTPSMTPRTDGSSPPGGFKAGDTILVKLCDPEEIQVGDIITYVPGSDPTVYLTHRVARVLDHLNDDQGIFFVTKGDANDSEDPPIKGDMMVGKKIFTVPGAGGVLQFMQNNLILSLVIVASAIGFVILLRMYLSFPKKKVEEMVEERGKHAYGTRRSIPAH